MLDFIMKLPKYYRQNQKVKKSAINSAYAGASNKVSLSQWQYFSGDANAIDLPNLEVLRDRVRDLVRNSPVASGAIRSLLSGVIGSGLKLKASIDRKYLGLTEEQALAWENKVEQEFRVWAESPECDYFRQSNLDNLQRLAFKSWMINGDVFVLLPFKERAMMPYDLRVQLIEADRVSNDKDMSDTAEMAGGIKYDSDGIRKSIFIRNPHPGSLLLNIADPVTKWKEVDFIGSKTGRLNVLHLIDLDRVGQSRGVSIFAPIIEIIKQISEYISAEVQRARNSQVLTAAITSNPPDGTTSYTGDEELKTEDILRLGAGTIYKAPDYHDIKMLQADSPNNQFATFFDCIVKIAGMAIDVPYEVFVKHFSSSYSASRAAILSAQKSFYALRETFANNFLQPIYEEFLTEAILKNRIQARGFLNDAFIRKAYSGAYWNCESQGSIDEVKDAKSRDMNVKNKFSSRTRECAKMGHDFKDIVRELAEEKKLLEEAGLIEDDFKLPAELTINGGEEADVDEKDEE